MVVVVVVVVVVFFSCPKCQKLKGNPAPICNRKAPAPESRDHVYPCLSDKSTTKDGSERWA